VLLSSRAHILTTEIFATPFACIMYHGLENLFTYVT
jgi:hypothetical protein